MNKIFTCSLIAAVPGFIFGFDTVLIAGADEQLRRLWGASAIVHTSLVMSMALWGTVVGAIFGSLPLNIIGRKKTLTWIGILFILSATGSLLAADPYTFSFFRFIGGLGIGASTLAGPAYISEIAPALKRGRYTGLYQLNIVVGILAAFLMSAVLDTAGPGAWRWMLGMQIIMAISFALATFMLPESPKWLLVLRKGIPAQQALEQLQSEELLREACEEQLDTARYYETIFMKKYRKQVALTFFIALFNQISGIHILLYYTASIFEKAGLQGSATPVKIGIGIVNLAFTVLGLALIDKIGRKPLLVTGAAGYIASFSLAAAALHNGWGTEAVLGCFFLFIASHAIGQGLVIWVFIAELFPVNVRASGLALGGAVHWVLAAVIPSALPLVFTGMPLQVIFALFIIIMAFQLFFALFVLPETKAVAGQTLQDSPIKNHHNDKFQKIAASGAERYIPAAGRTLGARTPKR